MKTAVDCKTVMQAVELNLLGAPCLAGKALPLSKLTALSAYLVLQNRWVTRDALLFLFYNSGEADARNSLRQLVLRLKSNWHDLEIDQTAKLRLLVPCDVQKLKIAHQQHDVARVLDFEPVLLEGLYLPDAPEFMEWLELERHEIRIAWTELALGFATMADKHEASAVLKKVLNINPLCEEAVQVFLERCEPKLGKMVFEQFKQSAAEMGFAPSLQTQALFDRLGVLSQPSTQHNLPFSITPFVGREQQLRQLHEIIEHQMSRLITVVGLGGMGKTRLALQAVHGWLEAGFDGVYLVTLADIQDIAGLPNAIASAMNIPVYTDVSTELLVLLQQKRIMLLLDNFEHLTLEQPRGFLHDLLERCPQLKVLVTSRVPLEIYGEWLFDLQGFEASESAGTQLFWQTAQRFNPKLDVTDQDSVLRIVEHLGGMPLAIELAAAWTRSLMPKEILYELEHGLKLETSSLAVPQRQRAIELVLQQSYDRLSKNEKKVLQGMCVFYGGATIDAARFVTNASLQDLQRLIETGLLQKNNLGRFHLHELLRQFVLTQTQQNDLETFLQNHAHYYLGFVFETIKGIEKDYVPGWKALTLEFANLEQILETFTRLDFQAEFTRIADMFLVFSRIRGLFSAALKYIEQNLEHPELSARVKQQNLVLKACILQRTFSYEASLTCFEQIMPFLEPNDTVWAYGWLGYCETLLRLGRAQEAHAAVEKSVLALENTKFAFVLMRAKTLLANACLQTEQMENARTIALETIQIAKNNNISDLYGDWYWEIGKVFIALHEPDTLEYLQNTFDFYKSINDTYSIQFIAREARDLYLTHGQLENQTWVERFLV